ncbi:hypothetical protein [Parasitella parasitica]|uniref:Eukaryotic translation initiation factor 4E n=1 Tax=Parasitella parasitica TaxID=35722 RepID=A0A0B7MVK5_9FUNG|nr:hypothetical protein [Parasitella parasitica]
MTEQETRPVVQEQNSHAISQESSPIDSEVKTVFHDPKNYNVKHPLQNTWTLWFDNPSKKPNAASWSENLKQIVSVNTVEDFWGVYNNIVKVNHLEVTTNYHIFKKGIRPEWEDPANAKGGKFSIQFPRNRTSETINERWLNLILHMLGEQFKYEDEICGAVVSVRKVFYRIALWIKSSEKNERIETIGRQLKGVLSVEKPVVVEFIPHGDSASKSGEKRFTI